MQINSHLLRLTLSSVTVVAVAACATTQHKTPIASPLACSSSEMLVVDNHSGYAIQVRGNEGHINSMPNSSILYATLQSGAVDTIRSLPGGNRAIDIVVQRPPLPSGALQQTTGYTARCAPRA